MNHGDMNRNAARSSAFASWFRRRLAAQMGWMGTSIAAPPVVPGPASPAPGRIAAGLLAELLPVFPGLIQLRLGGRRHLVQERLRVRLAPDRHQPHDLRRIPVSYTHLRAHETR